MCIHPVYHLLRRRLAVCIVPGVPYCRRQRSRGAALIELALILPFLLVVTLTVVDISRALYMKGMVTSAAREGARMAIELATPTVTSSADNDSVKARVDQVLSAVTTNASYGLSAVTVNVIGLPGHYQVTVSGDFSWIYLKLFNYFGAAGFTNPQVLTASSTMRRI
jgi:Flp pilus assembly protein TadG